MILAAVLLVAYLLVILFLGKALKYCDNPVPRRLSRRPNVRVVAREQDDAA